MGKRNSNPKLLIAIGLVYIFEAQHLVHAFSDKAYFSGAVTALAFPIVAFFYWQELFKNWSK